MKRTGMIPPVEQPRDLTPAELSFLLSNKVSVANIAHEKEADIYREKLIWIRRTILNNHESLISELGYIIGEIDDALAVRQKQQPTSPAIESAVAVSKSSSSTNL